MVVRTRSQKAYSQSQQLMQRLTSITSGLDYKKVDLTENTGYLSYVDHKGAKQESYQKDQHTLTLIIDCVYS